MYLSIPCDNCGRDHPAGAYTESELNVIIYAAATGLLAPQAYARFTRAEWVKVLSAEIARRMMARGCR